MNIKVKFNFHPQPSPKSFIDTITSTINQFHRGVLEIFGLGGENAERRPKVAEREPKPRKRPSKQKPKPNPVKESSKQRLPQPDHLNMYLRLRLNLKRLKSNLKRKPQQGISTETHPIPSHLAPLPPSSAQRELLYSRQAARSLPSPPVIQFTPWTPILASSPPPRQPTSVQNLHTVHNKTSPSMLHAPADSSVLEMAEQPMEPRDTDFLVNPKESFDSPAMSINSIDAAIVSPAPATAVFPDSDQYLSDFVKSEQLQESYIAPGAVEHGDEAGAVEPPPPQQEDEPTIFPEGSGDVRTYPPFIFSVDSLNLSGPLSKMRNMKGEPLDEVYTAPKRYQEVKVDQVKEDQPRSTDDAQSLQRVQLNGLAHIVQYIPYDPEYLAHIYGNSVVTKAL